MHIHKLFVPKLNNYLDCSIASFTTTVPVNLVRPHLEYAATIWWPFLQKDKAALEKVQKFALRMIYHAWSLDYENLLRISTLPTLEERRVFMKLCLLYQILNGLCYFNPRIFSPCTSIIRHHASHSLTLYEPFCHTTSFKYSFVPHTISLWNRLDSDTVSASTLFCFRNHLFHFMFLDE